MNYGVNKNVLLGLGIRVPLILPHSSIHFSHFVRKIIMMSDICLRPHAPNRARRADILLRLGTYKGQVERVGYSAGHIRRA